MSKGDELQSKLMQGMSLWLETFQKKLFPDDRVDGMMVYAGILLSYVKEEVRILAESLQRNATLTDAELERLTMLTTMLPQLKNMNIGFANLAGMSSDKIAENYGSTPEKVDAIVRTYKELATDVDETLTHSEYALLKLAELRELAGRVETLYAEHGDTPEIANMVSSLDMLVTEVRSLIRKV